MIILNPDTKPTLIPYTPGMTHTTAEMNYYNAFYPLQFTAIGPDTKTPDDAVTDAGDEAIVLTFGRHAHAVQVSGTFVGTVKVEVSLEESLANWIDLDTFTTEDLKQYLGVYYAMRFSISAYTSGNPLVTLITQR